MKFVVLNVGLGPLIGMAWVLPQAVSASPLPQILANIIGMALFTAPFAYFFGAVPALLHALTMLVAFRVWPNRSVLALTPISGFGASLLFYRLIFTNSIDPFRWETGASTSLAGAVAAMGCMVLAYRFGIVAELSRRDGWKTD